MIRRNFVGLFEEAAHMVNSRHWDLGTRSLLKSKLDYRATDMWALYGWDILNRMTSFTSSGTTSYVYRADGMRVSKSNSPGSTSYRYDGQMGMEDIDFASSGTVSKVTDFGIGARGIDAMSVTQSGTTSASYPLYDAHGNMISTLTKQATGRFAYSALCTFDAWGVIRRGAQASDPKGRYCANLGHKQDDESGLVYMRAGYYDSTCGRFVSQNSSIQGENWFSYCCSNPIQNIDRSGNDTSKAEEWRVTGLLFCCGSLLVGMFAVEKSTMDVQIGLALAAGICFSCALNCMTNFSSACGNEMTVWMGAQAMTIGVMILATDATLKSEAGAATTRCFTYCMEVLGALCAEEIQNP